MSLHIALFEPEIPPNTGNIIRLCANANAQLHLIHPLGFPWDDKRVRRAGLDYHEFADVQHHLDFDAFLKEFSLDQIYAVSTKGTQTYSDNTYKDNDVFLFGPETRGLPPGILKHFPPDHIIRIPMQANSRSLNLSNATAVILYEALRQQHFAELA